MFTSFCLVIMTQFRPGHRIQLDKCKSSFHIDIFWHIKSYLLITNDQLPAFEIKSKLVSCNASI